MPELALPPYVPQIDASTKLEGVGRFVEQLPAVSALSLGAFISEKGTSYRGGIQNVQRLRNRGAKSVILVGTSKDRWLEGAWREPERFIEALRQAEIQVVFGPAFSLYLSPRMPLERLANRARNLAMYQALSDAGILCIPAVGFIDPLDAERTGGWVNRLGLQAVTIDLQSADSKWGLTRDSLAAFLNRATSLKRIVVNGVAKPNRVAELVSLARPIDPAKSIEVVLTNAKAYQLARSRHDYYRGEDGNYRDLPVAATSGDLFANLLRFYTQAIGDDPMPYAPLSLQPRLRGL